MTFKQALCLNKGKVHRETQIHLESDQTHGRECLRYDIHLLDASSLWLLSMRMLVRLGVFRECLLQCCHVRPCMTA